MRSLILELLNDKILNLVNEKFVGYKIIFEPSVLPRKKLDYYLVTEIQWNIYWKPERVYLVHLERCTAKKKCKKIMTDLEFRNDLGHYGAHGIHFKFSDY